MYCSHCGKEVSGQAVICPYCGCMIREIKPVLYAPRDKPNAGFATLSFFFPFIGLILYLVWKDDYPQRAKSAGTGAIVGTIVAVLFGIIFALAFWRLSMDLP